MNRISSILSFVLILISLQTYSQQKKWASHGYRKIETKITDLNDPEKNGRQVEIIDRKGRTLELWEWNEKDRISKHVINTYTPKKFESRIYSGNDSLKSTELIEYDDRGRKIRQWISDKRKNKEEEVQIEYDKWGNKVKERVLKNNQVGIIRTYQYNKEGLLEKLVHTDAEGKVLYEKVIHYYK